MCNVKSINDNITNISNNINIYNSLDINTLLNNINENTSILLFDDNFQEQTHLFKLHKNKHIDKLIVITNSKQNIIKKRLFINSKISKSILEHVKKNLIIIFKIDNNYNNMKNIIINLIDLKNISNELSIELGITTGNSIFLGFIQNNNSIYFNDLITSLKSIYISDKYEQYKFIYDNVCDYLDSEFRKNNFCKFENDSCIANKNNQIPHSTMGCCYSFDHSGFWSPTFIENVKLCKYMNCKTCSTKCISCKMFTCKYLKNKNIIFNTHNLLLLDCFFNKKQHLILESNFFKTEEEILNKLLEKNSIPFFWYYLAKQYLIK